MSTLRTGPLNSICDISGLRVGNAIDSKVKTGVTVLTGDAPFTASYAVLGGAPGTRDTDLLEPDKTVQSVLQSVCASTPAAMLVLAIIPQLTP